jgi:NitT/TauT family transport system ATP-binding protein
LKRGIDADAMRLIADRISHAFADLDVLDGIDLAVESGEIVAVIGPSGCGKSTLLGILGGLIAPTEGNVHCSGEEPRGCLNPLTYVFQDFSLLPWRSAAGNVAFVLEHHGISAAEIAERVARVLALTGLAEFADALPKQLSGGMRQRVGIARALAVEPAVLLLDEPLSALDAQTRDILLEEFLSIWQSRRTTAVYVTHNLDEALRVADRVCVLSRRPGRIKDIVTVAPPRETRRGDRHRDELAMLRERLWSSIREEARVAEREVQHG